MLRELVRESLRPMTEAQIANAMGIKYLVARHKKTGKFIEVTEEQTKAILSGKDDTLEMLEVWEKHPSVQAFQDLLDRTLDKPKQSVDVEATHKGGISIKWEG